MGLIENERGQGTVEAAFVIPVLFLLMLMLLQPGIVLYDYIVMNDAAAETCRLLATVDGNSGEGADSCNDFIRNRLAAIPQHDCFHVHGGDCSWFIQVEGGENSGVAYVVIENELKPLPLLDVTLQLLGVTNGSGNLEIGVSMSSTEQPGWVARSIEGSPSQWAGAWL